MAFSQVLAAEALRCGVPLPVARWITPVFMNLTMQMSSSNPDGKGAADCGGRGDAARRTGRDVGSLSMRFRWVPEEASLFKSLHHYLQRLHRLKILGRDLGLGKGETELGFDLELQLHPLLPPHSNITHPRPLL